MFTNRVADPIRSEYIIHGFGSYFFVEKNSFQSKLQSKNPSKLPLSIDQHNYIQNIWYITIFIINIKKFLKMNFIVSDPDSVTPKVRIRDPVYRCYYAKTPIRSTTAKLLNLVSIIVIIMLINMKYVHYWFKYW